MNMLQKYIARQYLINVGALLLLLFAFVVTIDVLTNLDEFMKGAEALNAGAAGTSEEMTPLRRVALTGHTILLIWGPRLLQLFNYLIGVVMIAGMGFTCAQLVKHREVLAMIASGISLYKLGKPFMIVALGLSALQFANQELLLPSLATLLTREPDEVREPPPAEARLVPDANGRLWSAKAFTETLLDERTGERASTLTDLAVFERVQVGDRLRVGRVVTAESATWDRSGWNLAGGAVVHTPASSPLFDGRVLEPIDRLDASMTPTRMRALTSLEYAQNLGWGQISETLASGGLGEQTAERLDRLRWGRFSVIAANLITLMAALPFFLKRMPQTMVVPALQAAPVALLGLAAGAASAAMDIPGLPVWLGVFLPPLVLAPLALALYTGMKT